MEMLCTTMKKVKKKTSHMKKIKLHEAKRALRNWSPAMHVPVHACGHVCMPVELATHLHVFYNTRPTRLMIWWALQYA